MTIKTVGKVKGYVSPGMAANESYKAYNATHEGLQARMLVSGVPYLITLIIMTAAVIGATILISRLQMNKLYTNFIVTVDERNPEGGTYAGEVPRSRRMPCCR